MRKKYAIERKLRETRMALEVLKATESHLIDQHNEMMRLEGSVVALAWVLEKT